MSKQRVGVGYQAADTKVRMEHNQSTSYLHFVVGEYTGTLYGRPWRFKSEAVEAFKAFRAAAENGSGKRIQEIMTDNTRELSIGEVSDICEYDGIKLHTTVPYLAEPMIRVLTNAVRALLLTRACREEASAQQRTFAIGRRLIVRREVGACGLACVRRAGGVNAVRGPWVGLRVSTGRVPLGACNDGNDGTGELPDDAHGR